MGSSELMEESTRHRRRPIQSHLIESTKATNKFKSLVQVPSGDGEESQQQQQQLQQQKHQRESASVDGKKRRKRVRRPSTTYGNLAFLQLYLQVAATLLVIAITITVLYRQIYPYDPNASLASGEIVYVVDDDYEAGKKTNDGAVMNPFSASNHEGGQQQQAEKEDMSKISSMLEQQRLQRLGESKQGVAAAAAAAILEDEQVATLPPLPNFALSEASNWDAFALAQKLHPDDTSGTSSSSAAATHNETTQLQSNSQGKVKKNKAFWDSASQLRSRFVNTYGTENYARMLLDKGMTTFFSMDSEAQATFSSATSSNSSMLGVPADIHATACRLQHAQQHKRPFLVAFGGYSVTVGRGNYFEHSFPFQFQRLASPLFELAGIPQLQVENAAIGGCPSFPYGWCMTNFWGYQPDVVSWDYSMNEAGGIPEGLEAYVRQLLATYQNTPTNMPPKLIVKDTHLAGPRRDILGSYAAKSVGLYDPLVIHTGPAVKPFLDRPEPSRPIGFQDWRKFGAPPGAPGQALHHPAVKEHELLGWMLTMHFMTALEYLVHQNESGSGSSALLKCPGPGSASTLLPPPITAAKQSSNSNNSSGASTGNFFPGILFGHHIGNNSWQMNPIQCRTTFQPLVGGDLSELVVTGTMAEDLDPILPKSQMYYNKGWTLDLSKDERNAKKRLSIYPNGLGFVDSKEAYYGIFESPVLKLLLPYESLFRNVNKSLVNPSQPLTTTTPQVGHAASKWFESIVICQVNEKRDASACNMETDLGFLVGGVNITSNLKHMMKDTGTLYLGKKICVQLEIPPNATLTSHNEQLMATASAGQVDSDRLEKDQVGLLVEVKVTNPHIVHIQQACSVSHVVWEEKVIRGDNHEVLLTID